MKRQLFSALVLLWATILYGQTDSLPRSKDGEIAFEAIINTDSVNAIDLFSRAKMFITNSFKSGKEVTQLIDENTNTIVGKGYIGVVVVKILGTSYTGKVWFSISISCKDGKYRYKISEFELEYQGNKTMPLVKKNLSEDEPPKTVNKKQWLNVKHQTGEFIIGLITDLKKSMDKSITDW